MLHRISRERKRPVPLPIATAIIVSALHGLHAAHEARSETGQPLQIVHRDVSPHNILVGADGAVRVLDFGVAKAVQARPDTRPMIKGKFSYIAPEVLRGEEVTRKADIFAASVVFWELATGKKLFGGANVHERLHKILSGQYPPPSSVNPDLPAVIDRIVMRGLHPDVASRCATALEMAVDIETSLAPASQRVVGEWVEGLAGPALEQRSELLQQIEVSHINSVAVLPIADAEHGPKSPRADVDASGSSLQGSEPPFVTKPSARRKLAVLAALGSLAVGGVLMLWPASPSTPAAPAPASATARLAAEPAPVPSAAAGATAQVAQDPAPTVARAQPPVGSPEAQNRNRPWSRSPAPSRHGSAAKAPGNSKTFLPDDL